MIYNWHRKQKAKLTPGDRAADIVRNGMGSWGFVLFFVLFMGVWATLNTVVPILHWDSYPFILLNLFLSTLAALQGSILLIAAKRQDGISAAMAKHDYDTNIRAKHEIEQLTKLNEHQLEIIKSLHANLVGGDMPAMFSIDIQESALESPQNQQKSLSK
jgi:uncharacterized membrane protein